MNAVFYALAVQIGLGALDNFWHHELTERLPAKRSARFELALHATREFFYGVIFLALAWFTWHGIWAWSLLALLVFESGITLTDFLVEDVTRRLPPLERVLHTVLALNVGIVMALLVPIVLLWAAEPSAIVPVSYGAWSYLLTVCAAGVFAWSVRDEIASLRWMRPPLWLREPYVIGQKSKPRCLLVTGATGFIGKEIARQILRDGDRLIVLTRNAGKAWEVFGPHALIVESLDELADDETVDAIVNLAGAPIAAWPWTARRRRKLIDSRIQITNAIVDLIARLNVKPDVLINASAIGYYGVHAEKRLIESDAASAGFQSELCARWENAAMAAEALGTRVCLLRLGIVLGTNGGVLPQLMRSLLFRCHVIFGAGGQWVSWIHIDDVLRLIAFATKTQALRGPVNATTPGAVRHEEMMAQLAKRGHSRFVIRVPARLMRLLLGELAEIFVDGQKVAPVAAPALGFEFRFEKLHRALNNLLDQKTDGETIEVYYDSACPMCKLEIGTYREASQKAQADIAFTDVAAQDDRFTMFGMERDTIRRRIYVRSASGTILSGLDAMIAIWQRLPAFSWLGRVAQIPGVHAMCAWAYDIIAAPILNTWRM